MTMASHLAGIDHGAVKATNFMAIVVFLKEETRTARSPVAHRFAVCYSSGKCHRRAIYRIVVTLILAVAAVGEGDLGV